MKNTKRLRQASILRLFRKIHRWSAISLFSFFVIVSVTGLLLGWKKHSGELLLAKTQQGTSSDLKTWLPLDSLNHLADLALKSEVDNTIHTEVDRIDVRKEKGIVKFVYKEHYWGVQIDGATGKILDISRRNSDMIENIHDGSIIDSALGTSNGQFKLIYTSIMGLALLTFTITGFWLWYGPKHMRKTTR